MDYMGFFTRLFSKPMRNEVETSCRAAGMAICLYLFKRYEGRYGEQTAAALAAAVANGLFDMPPGNETGREFLNANVPLIESHIRALSSEFEIRSIFSKLAHTKFNIAGKTGTLTPQMILWLKKMEQLGILIPIDQIVLPPTIDEMKIQVANFQMWVQSQ